MNYQTQKKKQFEPVVSKINAFKQTIQLSFQVYNISIEL